MLFLPNPKFLEELMGEGDFHDGLVETAEAVADNAKTAMPRGMDERRGHIADAFEVVEDGDQVFVVNLDSFFHLAEWGSINNPVYAPLRRGVQAAGLRLEESPKP
jgi:hypothetical protein